MANEKNLSVAEEVNEAAIAEEVINEEEVAMDDLPLFVEREKKRGANGKVYSNYFVRGVRFGREIRANVTPKELSGYAVLEDIFSTAKDGKVKLEITWSVREGADKKLILYNTYSLSAVDELGVPIVLSIKAYGDTSGANLSYLIDQARKALELGVALPTLPTETKAEQVTITKGKKA